MPLPKKPQLTSDELMALPPFVDMETAARAFNIGRDSAYRLARMNELPVPVVRIGKRLLVTKASLLALVGMQPSSAPTSAAPVRAQTVKRTVGVTGKR